MFGWKNKYDTIYPLLTSVKLSPAINVVSMQKALKCYVIFKTLVLAYQEDQFLTLSS